uniref:von Willebrand factor A domain containing 5B2 n=1 Tax=Sinocyclocheilus anshuiensis TaxID=1608454 RepID=A0A671LVB0_9TELE
MPGLKNRTTWAPLLLKTSDITSCANGCSLGITAHLTYVNTDPEPVEGVFVYPLGEKEVVVGFEAVVSGRLVSVELQSRGKLEDCCLDCCPGSALHTQCGHLLLDEDLERSTFIVSTGQIGPLEIVSVVISTTLELPTLENGAIRLVYPTVLTPINPFSRLSFSPTMCFGSVSGKQERMLGVGQQCTHALLTSTATNLSPYQLSFQLLFRGACLLAGLESPTHALRADADPSAQSASATYITLAMEHSCDRHLEIILHLSEPHSPLVILERGRLTFSEYEQQIRARRDYIRFARKEFVRRRYHKDLLLNPVLMLNFCPDLLSEPTELQQASRELIFLIDNSNTMTQHNINKIKVLAISCMSSCSSGTTFWHMCFFTSDVRWRIQQDSYVQDQYVLTHCSLSSEKAFLSVSPQAESSVLGMGSLPHGLERMEPTQGRGLSRWESPWTQNATSSGDTDSASGKVTAADDIYGLLFPASPLDWDTFTDPEGLFSAAPPGEFQASGAECRSVIHGMLGGRAVSWEVRVDLSLLWDTESSATLSTSTGSWDEIIHQLTARSVIRDFENMAEKETDIEVERAAPSTCFFPLLFGCVFWYGCVCRSFQTVQNESDPDQQKLWNCLHVHKLHHHRHQREKSTSDFFGSKSALKGNNGKQAPLKPHCLSAETERHIETDSPDYLPLVHLQLASGAFLLSDSYSECLQIPLDRLKRASPYLSHRSSLSPPFRCTSPPTSARHMRDSWSDPLEEGSPKLVGGVAQADSGRGSETDTCEGPPLDPAETHGEELAQMDVESSSWATAVALAWLEHRCAGFFVEWELVAAKADFWLKCQSLPEGVDLAGLRAAARQLFLLLRHWDENIKLNVLCYNPNNM